MANKDILKKNYIDGLVSVIIPMYNAERFILETLTSALNQTYKDIEVIIIDDCSTDRSKDLVKSITDARIKLIELEKNGGVANARNKGMEASKGRYISFLDSDDVWESNKIERQVIQLSTSNYALSYTGVLVINENGKAIKERNVPSTVCYRELLRSTPIATSSVVIDKSKTGIFKMPIRKTGEDYATWLIILKQYGKACGIKDTLLKYRIVNGSLSSNRLDSFKDFWYAQHIVNHVGIIPFICNYFMFSLKAIKKHYF